MDARARHDLPRCPLVSVVVTSFNYGRYVGAAVESALSQEWPALEVIVVDDGSTDDSRSVLRSFGSSITLIEQENAGVNAATDAGVAAAAGDLITFLDADDLWPQGRVRVLAETLRDHPEAGAVYGDMTVTDEHGAVLEPSFNRAGMGVPPSGRFLGRMLSFNCVSAGAMMVRAALRHLYHPIPSYGGWHDWWMASQILRTHEILAIPDVVNLYRRHGANQNIGADEVRRARLLRVELPFRRWSIANTPPPLVTLEDLLSALRALDWALSHVARFAPLPAGTLVTAGDRARAEGALATGRSLVCRGQVEDGLARIVASIAHDPTWPEPRAVLDEAFGVLRAAPEQPPSTAERVHVMAVQDVLDAPTRLSAWVAEHPGGEATLVISHVDNAASEAALLSLFARLGLEDSGADVLALAEHDAAAVSLRLGRPIEPIATRGALADAA